ncbi:hypothetical protein K492DRAFT_195530 [Lichtheimia hyalospora FSU 10163]|nr:hypothetical protein K492DRAFT_195530 [Lichtheimia hyalospora FSU 10163]
MADIDALVGVICGLWVLFVAAAVFILWVAFMLLRPILNDYRLCCYFDISFCIYHVGSFFRWSTSICRRNHDQDNFDDDGPGLPIHQQPKQDMNQLTRPPPAVIMTTK